MHIQLSRRFFAMLFGGMLFSLPFIVIVYQSVTALNAQIDLARKEQLGVLYHKDLLGLFQSLQELRGFSSLKAQNDKFIIELTDKKKDILQAITTIEKEDKDSMRALGVNQHWQALKGPLLSLLAEKKPTTDSETYSRCIDSLLNFINRVADVSYLKADPDLDTDYLADAMIVGTPRVMATLGKIRSQTTTLLMGTGHETEKQLLAFQLLNLRLQDEDKDILDFLELAHDYNQKYAQPLIDHQDIIEPQLEEFERHFESITILHQNELPPGKFYEISSELMDAYNALYDSTATDLLVLLHGRQAQYALKRNIEMASSGAGLLGFISLIIFLAISLSRVERNEREIKRYSTELEEQKIELINARTRADQANATKSDFLANMSHELRTPLNSIIGLNRLVYEDKKVDEEVRAMIGVAYRSATNLLDIVNDILDLSKIEAGELSLETITFSLQEVVDGVMETMVPLSSAKGLTLSYHIAPPHMPYLNGDPFRVGRVLINLVGNAIKYTPHGSVAVDIECHEGGDNQVTLECRVIDSGIGIDKDKQKTIFDKFAQADSSITRKFGGTGLGLHITKNIVEKMGGKIGVRSEPGKGSQFWFSIPFTIEAERALIAKRTFSKEGLPRLPAEQRKMAKDVHVLIVEDHFFNQFLMNILVSRMGLKHFEMVDNGQAALEAVENTNYDLVLMDCHMPVMSGYEATTRIREREQETGRHVPIIAMTADAMKGTRERCLKAGMDYYISKPINADELRHLISRWVTFDDENGEAGEDQPSPSSTTMETPSLSEFARNEQELQNLVDLFVKQSEGILSILRNNCSGGENTAWVEAAHKLKGGASAAKAARLAELCNQAQTMRVASAADRQAMLDKINAAYEEVRNILLTSLASSKDDQSMINN